MILQRTPTAKRPIIMAKRITKRATSSLGKPSNTPPKRTRGHWRHIAGPRTALKSRTGLEGPAGVAVYVLLRLHG
jgi:hypothetical protein